MDLSCGLTIDLSVTEWADRDGRVGMDRGGSTSESLVNLMSTRATSDVLGPDDRPYEATEEWLCCDLTIDRAICQHF